MTNDKAEPTEKVQLISALADFKGWEIGPTKESDSALQVTFVIPNWEDVKTVRRLAAGKVVIRVMPLQIGLPETVGCYHPKEAQMAFDATHAVCTNCGCIIDVPTDDQAPPLP